MRVIRTERLRLEPVTPANAGALWDVLQEPDLREYQDLPDVGLPQFERTVATRPANLAPGVHGRFEWLILLGERKRPVGWVSLRIAERNASSGEIGYSVVAEARNRGIASEAVKALVAEAFKRARLRSVRAYCVPENAASLTVLRRIGFEGEGIVSGGATVNGQPVDVIAHELDRKRWDELSARDRSAIGS
ncbi:MAG TPA: GNAT family N-acetyltransferase [Verrucomicrobiae bacterium]|nr:GNAT family N-acetyltransferase [Verrucomicrobiae bacterium]